jgi:hypothetical protein
VVHCTAGKDRTGVITALMLGLLGVPEETIIHDYARCTTSVSLPREVRQRACMAMPGTICPLLGCPPGICSQHCGTSMALRRH